MSKHDLLFINIAQEFAKMSYANRKKVGALIVKDNVIISDGYNGTPAGFDNNCEDANGKTLWYVLHAEANAITKLCKTKRSCDNSTLYITLSPCKECSKLIFQSGIKRVVFKEQYKDISGINFLGNHGVKCEQIMPKNEPENKLVDIKNNFIDWDKIKKMIEPIEKDSISKLLCKKCGKVFFSKNYNGSYPLCNKHRNYS